VNTIQQKLADAKATDILMSIFGEDIPLPIDLEKVATKYKLKIVFGEFEDSNVLGLLDRERKQVAVTAGESPAITAYTIASCIGHYVLHKELIYVESRFSPSALRRGFLCH
jgi:Zn-dependent peptidase ImmA (M78 family)